MLAVCLLDLDDFKTINDSFGQGVGDQILVEIADRLTEIIRDDDTAARLGGDEFVLLLNGFSSLDEVDFAVQRIYKSLAQPIILNGNTFNISQSIGVAAYPQDNVDADTLLRHADQAMYQAKRLGRKRFTYFDQDSEQVSQNRIQEISTIKQALVVLGLEELKKFLSVLFTAQVASAKPPELMRLSLTRARFAECLAIKHGKMKDTPMAFLAGMFSLIDGILDQDMAEILEKLPLSIEIKDAILKKEGLIADYLSLVAHYELADWGEAKVISEQLSIDVKTIPDSYHDAVHWANTQMEAMSK